MASTKAESVSDPQIKFMKLLFVAGDDEITDIISRDDAAILDTSRVTTTRTIVPKAAIAVIDMAAVADAMNDLRILSVFFDFGVVVTNIAHSTYLAMGVH